MSHHKDEFELYPVEDESSRDVMHEPIAPIAADVLRECASVDHHTPAGHVMHHFLTQPQLRSLPVVDATSGRPVGLINHAQFMSNLAKPYYKEVFSHKSCSVFMDSDPVIVDCKTPLEDVSGLLADSSHHGAADGFIIVADARYAGIGHTQDVLRLMADTHRLHSQRLALNRDQLEETVRIRTQALTEARDAADAANTAKSAFLANMSHEIRTPMNGILGMAHLLRRSGMTPKQVERLDIIEKSGMHLLGIINNILDISKIEARKVVLDESPISVAGVLDNVRSMLLEQANSKNLDLIVDTVGIPSQLEGDAIRLQQAVINFASNAIKFTDQGRVILRASVLEETEQTVLIQIEVQDTGIGIPPEVLPRLFTAFEQADNSTTRKYGGTGLGLVITRRLAELMGGKTGVESRVGFGSTFWLTARLKRKHRIGLPKSPRTETANPESTLRREFNGTRVLVVDDEPINRMVARTQLEEVGLVVDSAGNGLQAVEKAQRIPYAAIFMDMQMPELDGMEATRRIRNLPRHAETIIIAMTANVFAEDRIRCLESGMDDFLMKPFTPDALFHLLLRKLEQKRTYPAARVA